MSNSPLILNMRSVPDIENKIQRIPVCNLSFQNTNARLNLRTFQVVIPPHLSKDFHFPRAPRSPPFFSFFIPLQATLARPQALHDPI